MSKRPSRGVSSGIGSPTKMTGRDGDLTIRKTKEGKILYVKEHGSWHPINTGVDTAKLKKDVDRLIRSVNTLRNDNNPFPTINSLNIRKDKIKLGTDGTGLTIKNNSGALILRNEADGGDATMATSYLTGAVTSIANHELAASATTDTTDAGNIISGTLHLDRVPTITNAKLSNDSVSFGGVSVDLGASDDTPAFDLQDSTNTNLADIKSGTQITTSQINVSANVKTLLDNANTADFKTDLSLSKGDVGLGNVTNDAQVAKSTFDAHTILAANSDNTPSALAVGASEIVGRKASGNITSMTKAETQTVLNVADGATNTVDLTVDGAGTVHANNYTNTTYSEATGSAAGLMSIAHHDKLDGIDSSADVTDATTVGNAGALMDSECTSLADVKALNQSLTTSADPQFNSINLGHASDTTIARESSGEISVEGNRIYRAGCTDIPIADTVAKVTEVDGNTGAVTASEIKATALTDATAGTLTASKAIVVDSNKAINTMIVSRTYSGSLGPGTYNLISGTATVNSASGSSRILNGIGINLDKTSGNTTGYTLNVMDLQVDGASKLKVSDTGAITPTVAASDPWDTVANERILIIDEDSSTIGYRTAAQLKGDISGISASSTFTDITVTKEHTGTTTATTKAAFIDYDLTGLTASGQTATNIGLDLDLNTNEDTHVGDVNNYGIDIDVVGGAMHADATAVNYGIDVDVSGATSGTQTNIGVAIDADGADTNIGLLINTAGTHIKLEPNADTGDAATISVADTGDLTIATTDNAATAANLTLDIDGDLYIDVDGGSARITDNSGTYTPDHASSIATKAYVDNIYDIQRVGYYSTVASVSYIPLTGYVTERTSTTNYNENVAFVAPYNGTLEKIMWRSEIAQDGVFRNTIYESSDGTEVPGSLVARWDVTVDVAANITVEFDYTDTATTGDNTLTKGRIYAFGIDPASAPNDTVCTVVFKWDLTS